MVDVTEKPTTKRTAVAAGVLRTSAHVVDLISSGGYPRATPSRRRGWPESWPPSAPAI